MVPLSSRTGLDISDEWNTKGGEEMLTVRTERGSSGCSQGRCLKKWQNPLPGKVLYLVQQSKPWDPGARAGSTPAWHSCREILQPRPSAGDLASCWLSGKRLSRDFFFSYAFFPFLPHFLQEQVS